MKNPICFQVLGCFPKITWLYFCYLIINLWIYHTKPEVACILSIDYIAVIKTWLLGNTCVVTKPTSLGLQLSEQSDKVLGVNIVWLGIRTFQLHHPHDCLLFIIISFLFFNWAFWCRFVSCQNTTINPILFITEFSSGLGSLVLTQHSVDCPGAGGVTFKSSGQFDLYACITTLIWLIFHFSWTSDASFRFVSWFKGSFSFRYLSFNKAFVVSYAWFFKKSSSTVRPRSHIENQTSECGAISFILCMLNRFFLEY